MMGWKVWTLLGGLLLVLVGAVVYSLWPESGSSATGDEAASNDEHHKSLSEQLDELERDELMPDAGFTTVSGVVQNEDGSPVANAEVWVTLGDEPPLEGLSCEVCAMTLLECASPSTGREVVALAKAGKLERRHVAQGRAGSDGRFTLAEVPVAKVTVHARSGAVSAIHPLDLPYIVDNPDEQEELVVGLYPFRLEGKVVDEKEQPVAGAKLFALDRADGAYLELTSDGEGRFGGDIGSGAWLYIEASGFRSQVVTYAEESDMMVRLDRPRRLRVETRMGGQPVDALVELSVEEHPRRSTATGGTAIFEDLPTGAFLLTARYKEHVSPRTDVELNEPETIVRLDLKPAARLMVEVLNEAGEPLSEGHVNLEGNGDSQSLEIPGDGALTVFDQLAAGVYTVQVEVEGMRDMQRRIDVHGGDNHLSVTLLKASTLTGHVVDADGKPVPSATVELVSQIHDMRATTCDDEGAFTLEVEEPGQYRVRAKKNELGVLVTQVTAPAEGLVFKLEALGRLDVHVTGDRVPLKGSYVTVYGNGPNVEDGTTSPTDEHGVANFAGLHGGDYMVNVEQQGYQRTQPWRVKLSVGDRLEVTIALEKGVEIAGKVVDESGKPLPNVGIRAEEEATDAGERNPLESAYTDEDGAFTLQGLGPGRVYEVTAYADDHSLKAPLKVKAPQGSLVIRLDPMPQVRGRVVDEGGAAIAKFRVDGREIEAPDGRFSVAREKDADGHVIVTVDADGYQLVTVDKEFTQDLGDVTLKKAPTISGVVVDSSGQPVSGADVTCDQCIDSAQTGYDGHFSLAATAEPPETTITATRLNQRAHQKVTAGQNVTVTLQDPVRVEGIVKDPQGKPLQARVTAREVNGGDEQRVDSGSDGRFVIDLPEGLWMFITRASGSGQTVKVVPPGMFVTLGAPPGTCAVTITVAESVGDAWLVPGEPTGVSVDNLDDDGMYAGAVALDLPLPNRPSRSAGLQCGIYTLVTTDSSGVRRERVDVRTPESSFALGPAPAAAPTPAPLVPGPEQASEASAPDHPGQP
jgi:hypothetical protein